MRDAEIDAAAAREDFVAHRSGDAVRIGPGLDLRLRECDPDLHRATGTDRVPVGEQRLAERHLIDELVVELAQLTFGPDGVEPRAKRHAVRRRQRERPIQHDLRHAGTLSPRLELLPRDTAKPRYRRIGAHSRFLFGDRNGCADIRRRGCNVECRQRCVDIGGPAVAIAESRREKPAHERTPLVCGYRGRSTRRRRNVRRAAGQRQRNRQQEESDAHSIGGTRRGRRVGVRGFEPPTSCSQSKRATGLRYTPYPRL